MDEWKADIEKYLSGQLTPAERHALEKKALSDPFLADALEGGESIPAENFSADLNELNQKINGAGRNRWMWPLRIAASVIGIALVSTAIFFSVQDDSNTFASNQKKEEAKPATVKTDSIVQPELNTQKGAGEESNIASQSASEEKKKEEFIALNQSPKEEKQPNRRLKQSLAGGGGVTSAKPKVKESTAGPIIDLPDTSSQNGLAGLALPSSTKATADELVNDRLIATDIDMSTQQPVADTVKELKRANALIGNSGRLVSKQGGSGNSKGNMVVAGQVRDQQGQAIPGVNILVKGSNIGTITNTEGKYSIATSEQNPTLVYSFIGYVSQEQSVSKAKPGALDVQLQEDATQLSEVIVTGYSAKKDEGEPVVRLAEPIGGRKAYDQYLEGKKNYPQQALDNKVEGKVVIEFTVSITGTVADFNVIKKIGYGCEEEVIRLIKDGPQWNPSYVDNEAVESLVRVKTRFDLPGKK